MWVKIWAVLREPIEEAAKATIRMVFQPVIIDPGGIADVLPENIRDEYREWVREPKNRVYAVAILSASQDLALLAADKINPAD